MFLTNSEREFLAAFIREATTDPFNGPATDELHRRDIYYTDLSHLLAAYYREDVGDQGASRSLPPCGRELNTPYLRSHFDACYFLETSIIKPDTPTNEDRYPDAGRQ
jgi:hypothetical protein